MEVDKKGHTLWTLHEVPKTRRPKKKAACPTEPLGAQAWMRNQSDACVRALSTRALHAAG